VPDKYTGSCAAFETPDEEARMADYVRRNWDNFPYRPNHGDHEAYHFADVPIEDSSYAPGDIGASDHDVVHAIDAAIAELQQRAVPAPFSLKDDKEAILVLAHMAGDVHQPLHVGAIYLDAAANEVDPKSADEAEADSTAGGNFIEVGSSELHREWDAIPKSLKTTDIGVLAARAKVLPADTGPVESWPAIWASESVAAAAQAYSSISYQAGARLAAVLTTIYAVAGE